MTQKCGFVNNFVLECCWHTIFCLFEVDTLYLIPIFGGCFCGWAQKLSICPQHLCSYPLFRLKNFVVEPKMFVVCLYSLWFGEKVCKRTQKVCGQSWQITIDKVLRWSPWSPQQDIAMNQFNLPLSQQSIPFDSIAQLPPTQYTVSYIQSISHSTFNLSVTEFSTQFATQRFTQSIFHSISDSFNNDWLLSLLNNSPKSAAKSIARLIFHAVKSPLNCSLTQ